jgi:hypothetical protein
MTRGSRAWTLLGAAAAMLAGCATPTQPIPKYAAQASGPRAELVMRGQVQPGEAYGVYVFKDALNCTGPQRVGIGVASRDPETTSIDAGLSTAEVFMTKADKSICRVRWSFEPVAGRKYLVSALSTPTGCTARILDVTDPHKMVREASLRRRDVGGKLCIPMAQTTTVAEAASRTQAASEADLPIPKDALPGKTAVKTIVTDDDLRDLKAK